MSSLRHEGNQPRKRSEISGMELDLFILWSHISFANKTIGHICGLERKLEVTLGIWKYHRREKQIRKPIRDHCCSWDISTLDIYPQAFLPNGYLKVLMIREQLLLNFHIPLSSTPFQSDLHPRFILDCKLSESVQTSQLEYSILHVKHGYLVRHHGILGKNGMLTANFISLSKSWLHKWYTL